MTDNLSKFMAIWEIESQFRCPVIGAVLSVEKHKQILVRCGYKTSGMKPYEYHQCIMSRLFEENNVSVKVNNYLKSKARKYMLAVQGKSEKQIRELWEDQFEKGNVGPLMFAIVSYEDTPIELLQDVYGQVHMLAHANMVQIYDTRKQLVFAREGVAREKTRSKRQKEEIRQLVANNKGILKNNQQLEQKNKELTRQLRAIKAASGHDQSMDMDGRRQNERVKQLEAELFDRDEKLRVKEREKRSLQIEYFSLKQEKEVVEEQMTLLIDGLNALSLTKDSSHCNCSEPSCMGEACAGESCERYRLCAKRIFMVGGITKMKPYYRDIVEKAGGKFDYHDGYLKSTSGNLEARVKRSDLVICPVNCNSHNACLRVKKLCHRHNKQLKILSSSSLSAITQALFSSEHEAILN